MVLHNLAVHDEEEEGMNNISLLKKASKMNGDLEFPES
jgi:hypothetical protein